MMLRGSLCGSLCEHSVRSWDKGYEISRWLTPLAYFCTLRDGISEPCRDVAYTALLLSSLYTVALHIVFLRKIRHPSNHIKFRRNKRILRPAKMVANSETKMPYVKMGKTGLKVHQFLLSILRGSLAAELRLCCTELQSSLFFVWNLKQK